MAEGAFEPAETSLVRELLADTDIFINVGANVGYYCCHALSLGTKTIAFEPNAHNLRYLYKNITANGWTNVEVYPLALSDRTGIIELYGGSTGASIVRGWAGIPQSYVSLVPCNTLDTVLGGRVRGQRALILIDIEGAEKAMLDGASSTIVNDPRPTWIVEITITESQPDGVVMNPHFQSTFELFFRSGYRAFSVESGLTPVTRDDVAAAVAGRRQFATHNFLFRMPDQGP